MKTFLKRLEIGPLGLVLAFSIALFLGFLFVKSRHTSTSLPTETINKNKEIAHILERLVFQFQNIAMDQKMLLETKPLTETTCENLYYLDPWITPKPGDYSDAIGFFYATKSSAPFEASTTKQQNVFLTTATSKLDFVTPGDALRVFDDRYDLGFKMIEISAIQSGLMIKTAKIESFETSSKVFDHKQVFAQNLKQADLHVDSNTRKLLQKISPSNEFTVLADQIDAFQIEYGFKTSGENPRFTRNPKIVSKASLSAKNNPSPCYKPLKNNLKYILLRLRIQGENFERLAYL